MSENLKLESGRIAYQKKLVNGEIERPKKMNPVEKALANPKSLRMAINANCWECSCEQINEIRFCTATSCPLWHLRPYQKKE